MWVSFGAVRAYFSSVPNAGVTLAAAAATALYLVIGRSRYFGNTTPLLVAILLLVLVTTGVPAQPWLWAIPFLLTFIGGVFADVLESRHRRVFLFATVGVLLAQAALSLASLPLLAK